MIYIPNVWLKLCPKRHLNPIWREYSLIFLQNFVSNLFAQIFSHVCSNISLCLGGLFGVSSPSVLLLLSACCVSGYGCFVCSSIRFLQCFFIFSPLSSCIGQVLFGRHKFMSVTAFFLMKSVLRHGLEKNAIDPNIPD